MLALGFFLIAFHRHRRFEGQVFLLFLLGYGTVRFSVEFLRADHEPILLGHLTTSHLIAVSLLATAAALWPKLRRQ